MANIAVFVGSLKKASLNKKLAKNLETLAPQGTTFRYIDIGSLPLFNEELETEYPAAARSMKDIIDACDGVLFVTPEYNRSIPGVLKNAIDWASRPWGQNSFDSKPAGIVGVSVGQLGTAVAQAHLRSVLVYLNTRLMGQPELYLSHGKAAFDDEGVIVEGSKDFLQGYIEAFVRHINQ